MKKFTAIFVAMMCFAATSFAGDLLTASMFHSWTTSGADAVDQGQTGCSYFMNEASASNGLPYGDGNVYYLNYADLTSYDKLVLEFTAGTPRLLFNRDGDNGPLNPEIDGSKGMDYVEATEGKWVIDLAAIKAAVGYVHLNCIKGANWSDVTITTAELLTAAPAPTEEPNVKGNLLNDESFNFNGGTTGGWKFNAWNNGGGAATATAFAPGYNGSAYCLEINNPSAQGNNYDTQLPLTLATAMEQGKTYTVSFYAMAENANAEIEVGAQFSPWAAENKEWNGNMVTLSQDWKLYSLDFEVTSDYPASMNCVYFNVGKMVGKVYLDQISIVAEKEVLNDQPLTTDLYKDYTTNAEGDPFATDLNLNMNTRTVYGNKSIFAERYADLTPWNYMTVVFDTSKAPGTPQLIFNRQGVEDQSPEFLEINNANSDYVSYSQVDGTVNFWIIDLSKITEDEGFAHLNIIRGDKFVETYVTRLKLYNNNPAPGRFSETDDYYFYNVEADQWLGGANSWGTQASLIKHPQPFKLTYDYGDYYIDSYTYNNATSHFVGDATFFIDQPAADWTFTEIKDALYISASGTFMTSDGTSVVARTADRQAGSQWQLFTKDDLEAKMLDENDPFIDATFYAQVPNFSRNQAYTAMGQSPWTSVANNKNLSGGDNTNNNAESWRSSNGFNVYQTLTNLPTGVYKIDVQGAVCEYANPKNGEDLAVAYANYANTPFVVSELADRQAGNENSMAEMSASFSAGKYQLEPMYVTVTNGTLTIGVKSSRTDTWAVWDNFELTYMGDDILAEGEYYLYNAESGAWLGGANSWGTQASLIKHGMPVYVGEHQGGNVYTINTYTYNSATDHYLGWDAGGSGFFVDAYNQGLAFEKVGEAENEYIISANGSYIGSTTDAAAYTGNDDELTLNAPVVLTPTTDASQATHWFLVTRAEREATLAEATLDKAVDATFFIEVPNFSRNQAYTAQGQSPWTKEAANGNLSGGNNSNNCAESWRSSNGVKVYQTLNNLPNGVYKLYAQGAVCDYAKTNDDLAHLYANEKQRPFVVSSQETTQDGGENSMAEMSESFTVGKYQLKPIFVLVTDGTLEVGVETSRTDTWAVWDNFELYYLGADIDTVHVGPYYEMVASDKIQIEYEEGATVKEAAVKVAGYLNALHATSVDELVLFAVDTNAGLTFDPFTWVNFTGFFDAAGSVSGVANAAMKANLDLNAAKLTVENIEETEEPRYHAYAVVANPAQEKAVLVDIEVDFIDRPDFAATAIDNVNVNANKQIFDLTGREVKKATNGVYIINGVKTLVK